MNIKNNNQWLFVIIPAVLCAFIFELLFSKTLSPLYSIETCDSSVFKLMGQAILQGKTPYLDFFDHKGPFLYLIQAVGQLLVPGRLGLFIIAVCSLSISILCWYATGRLFTSQRNSWLTVFFTLLCYYCFSENGNLSEDWNIIFISISLYLIIRLFSVEEKHYLHLINGIAVGLCFASSFLIRPNDAVAFIGAPILGSLIWNWHNKNYKLLYIWTGGILLGTITLTSLFVIWFAQRKALPDLWYGLIGFNKTYAGGALSNIGGLFNVYKVSCIPFIVSLIVLVWKSPFNYLKYIIVPTSLFAYCLLGINAYLHYWITWVPSLFFLFGLFLSIQPNKSIKLLSICVFLSMLTSPICRGKNWTKIPIHFCNDVYHDIKYKDIAKTDSKALFEKLGDREKDSIWSYNLIWGNQCTFNVLIYNNIIPCNRVPLFFQANIDSSLLKYMDITQVNPQYILFDPNSSCPQTYVQRDSSFITQNYEIFQTIDSPELILYKRKQSFQSDN